MLNQRDRVRLRHMLDHALEAIGLAEGKVRSDLERDRLLNLALIRLLRSWARPPDGCQRKSVASIPRFNGPKSSACVTG